ncbi:N-acetylmuramoyl-L-alanine amidase [Desulfotomaculum arcticum]|uniref:N-acetylmuramoyl-L-alanine amidase n=1 Tax=Desulfotruncus arcticus DSM 17038 TaxID=1121424 RepID=A0A1I2N6Z7_9FIRM|nr:N-acetylmuramoyl-L-alanine amidase [Desulfotomaculum arcticum] [Desulfotruncus arcticus DSM 17038]
MTPRWKKNIKKILTGFALFTASCLVLPGNVFAATRLTVTGSTVNVRSGPDTVSAIVAKVNKNEQYNVVDKRGDWFKINANGADGWIAGWLVKAESVPDEAVSHAVVKTDGLNVRSGPGTTYNVVNQIKAGSVLEVISNSNDWYKVKLPDGNTGWVAGWLVTIEKTVNQEPAQQPAEQPPAAIPQQSQSQQPTVIKQATLTASNVNVREGPGTSYKAVAKVNSGEKYNVAAVNGQWLKISLPGGKSGWIAGWLASVTNITAEQPSSTPQQPSQSPSQQQQPPQGDSMLAVVNGSNVNVRGGPGTTHGVISQVSRGQKLGVIESTGDWYKVKLDGGVVGWIAGWLVNTEKAEASPAPGDPPVVTEDTDQSGNTDGSGQTNNGQPTEASKLEKIEANEDDGHTLVSISATGPLNYDMFLIKNPDRLVLDLKNIDPGDLPEKISIGTEVVPQIRTGWFSKEQPVFRVVFDLNGAVVSLDKLSEDRKQLNLDISIPTEGNFLQGRVIAIDPGHGGKDPGAKGPTGLLEKDVNLDIGLKLAEILKEKGAKVVMTRSDDSYVDLYEISEIAKRNGAEVFLSIHSNASANPSINGTSTYYRRDTGELAPGVNQADNRRLAGAIQSELLRSLERRSLGVLQANFVVLRTSSVPAALAEVAFISNSEEEQMLRQDATRQKIAEALADALNNYFSPTTQ